MSRCKVTHRGKVTYKSCPKYGERPKEIRKDTERTREWWETDADWGLY